MEEQAKETVIIVHGTWAAPVANQLHWYQLGGGEGGFVRKLDDALRAKGSRARCWAHCDQTSKIFHWSGENSWVARTRAADELGDYVQELRTAGWLCHIVAHSHGGNVLVEALPKVSATKDGDVPIGQLVTLGTPFIDVMSPVLARDKARREMLLGLGIMFIALQLYQVWYNWSELSEHHHALLVPTTLPIAMLFGGVFLRWRKHIVRGSWAAYFEKYWASVLREIAFWIIAAIVLQITFYNALMPGKAVGTPVEEIWSISGGLVVLGIMLRLRQMRRSRRAAPAPSGESASGAAPQFLALGSCMDEAWQVLHHLQVTENPLAAKNGLLRYLASSFVSSYIQRGAADRLYYSPLGRIGVGPAIGATLTYLLLIWGSYLAWSHPLPSRSGDVWHPILTMISGVVWISITFSLLFGDRFYAAYLLPFRWVTRLIGAIVVTALAIGPYMVRRAAWQLILRIAIGLEGYQLVLPTVEQYPHRLKDIGLYEEISGEAQKTALIDRSAWISGHLLKVSETFAKMTVTGVDVHALLKTIEADQTLVHAAYYTNEKCIERIADWIALGR